MPRPSGKDKVAWVLVVEDPPALAEVVAEGLRDQGVAVDIALDGLSAADKLNLAPYEVVVLDPSC